MILTFLIARTSGDVFSVPQERGLLYPTRTEQEIGRLIGTAIALIIHAALPISTNINDGASDRIDYLVRGELDDYVRRHRERQIGKREWAANSGSAKLCKWRTTDGIGLGLACLVVSFVASSYFLTDYVSYVF